MSKTEAQLAADKALADAFQQCSLAYAEDGEDPGVIVDAMAIVMTSRFEPDGRTTTCASVYFGGVETPRYRVTGMMSEAENRLTELDFNDDED